MWGRVLAVMTAYLISHTANDSAASICKLSVTALRGTGHSFAEANAFGKKQKRFSKMRKQSGNILK